MIDRRSPRRSPWSALFALASVLSLAGVGPVRSLEQALSPLLAPLEGLAARWLPTPDAEPLALLREPARKAFSGWQREVLGGWPATAGDSEALLAPVIGSRRERHELVLAVPAGAVELAAAVTHRGVLLGFVTELQPEPARAVVTLLGHPEVRTVAAEWRVLPESRPVSFLVTGSDRESAFAMRVEAPSSSVPPPADQLAWTRDVAALGDDLPSGLLLGRLQSAAADQPGGGQRRSGPDPLQLVSLVDAFAAGLVAVQGRAGATREFRQAEARLFASCRSECALRLDEGSNAGIARGDWVVQDGLFLGAVSAVSPWSALVDSRALPAALLIVSPAGAVVACGTSPASWPPGWRPTPGDLVAGGHLQAGGVVLGTVAEVDDEEGLQIARLAPDAARAVTVLGP